MEFARALEQRVVYIYRDSWIYKYYDVEIQTENYVVMFNDKIEKKVFQTPRYEVYVHIPKLSKLYFLPMSEWDKISEQSDSRILVESISKVPNGFNTKAISANKSLYYTPPYFIIFRTLSNIPSNYLIFNSFLKPNTESSILAMLEFDNDQVNPIFSSEMNLPFENVLSLNKILEFKIIDSNKTVVSVRDSSQLYVTVSLREE